MGTTGGDREKLYKTVQDANVYAVISPQMGKQVKPIFLSLVRACLAWLELQHKWCLSQVI